MCTSKNLSGGKAPDPQKQHKRRSGEGKVGKGATGDGGGRGGKKREEEGKGRGGEGR
jgi:hypothetical protein